MFFDASPRKQFNLAHNDFSRHSIPLDCGYLTATHSMRLPFQLPNSSTALALAYMLVSTLLLASMHGIVREVSTDLHIMVVVFFRNFCGLLVMLPLLFRHGLSSLKTNNQTLHLLRAGLGICAMFCWFTALTKIQIANATALSFSTSVFAAIVAWLFLGEKMRARRWAAIIVGFIGVLVVLRPTPSEFNAWSLLVLASAVAWGSTISIVKKLSESEPPFVIVAWMGISLTILSIPTAIIYWQTPTLVQLGYLLMIGLLGTGGHLLLTRALKLADVALVMSIDFARLIWTTIIGYFLFKESLDTTTAVGAVIIFLAGWYIIYRENKLANQTGSAVQSDGRAH